MKRLCKFHHIAFCLNGFLLELAPLLPQTSLSATIMHALEFCI